MSTFNVHQCVTANGEYITEGMRVRTNDWTEGVVISDESDERCCGTGPDNLHAPAQMNVGGVWYSDHAKASALPMPCLRCRHDHWFTVKLDDGSQRSYNGERLWKL